MIRDRSWQYSREHVTIHNISIILYNIFINSETFPVMSYNETRHSKTGLKIFAFFMPNEGLAGMVPAKPSFGITTTKVLKSVLAWGNSYVLF